MNLEVFREADTVWIRDTDTDDEWPLPAEVWAELSGQILPDQIRMLPPVWGPVSVEPTGASTGDNPDRRE